MGVWDFGVGVSLGFPGRLGSGHHALGERPLRLWSGGARVEGLEGVSLGLLQYACTFLLEVPEASTKPTRAHLGLLLRTETGRAT